MSQPAIFPNESLYRSCDELPLLMFKKYVLYNELQDMSEAYWERIHSEYTDITGDTTVKSLVMNVGKHTALTTKLSRITMLLMAIETCYLNEVEDQVDISEIITAARKEFKQRHFEFSRETYKADLGLCEKFLKDTVRQVNDLEKILHKEQGAEAGNSNNFFDDVLLADRKINKTPLILQADISTKTFALIYKDLQDASRSN